MFEWFCRKRINKLIALNKTLNSELQDLSHRLDLNARINSNLLLQAQGYKTQLQAERDERIKAQEALQKEETDSLRTNAFIDAIDNTISDALREVGRFPGKPAGFPDRVDVITARLKEFHAEIARLKINAHRQDYSISHHTGGEDGNPK